MNILFDISHPAHFHLFKNAMQDLQGKGHRIIITTRKKDVLIDLLDHEHLPYYPLTEPRYDTPGLALELLIRDIRMYHICLATKPDLLIGTSVNITHVGRLIGKKSLVFNEDDDDVVPLFSYLSYPFADRIINPDCISFSRWRNKRVLYPSYHELAYLHPDNFRHDETVLRKYGLRKREYVVARFSALKAHHDVGAAGITQDLWRDMEGLLKGYQIIKSIENQKSHAIEPWDMHHILAFSKMIISDSQTMTIEGSVLGIPAIRVNTFVGKSTVITELENRYKLAFGILPIQKHVVIQTVKSVLENPETEGIWQERRTCLLSDKKDLNRWMIDFIHHHL